MESQQRLTTLIKHSTALSHLTPYIAVNASSAHSAASRVSTILSLSKSKNRSWSQRCVNPARTTRAMLRKISVSEPAKVPWLRELDDVSLDGGGSSTTHDTPSAPFMSSPTLREWLADPMVLTIKKSQTTSLLG